MMNQSIRGFYHLLQIRPYWKWGKTMVATAAMSGSVDLHRCLSILQEWAPGSPGLLNTRAQQRLMNSHGVCDLCMYSALRATN